MDGLRGLYQKADRLSGGSLSVIGTALRRFTEVGAPEAAASLAYYAFFSFFPLLLVMISVGGFILERGEVFQALLMLVSRIVPVSVEFIEATINQALAQRGAVGLLGLGGLVWSASGAFSVLVKHINQAWPGAKLRSPLTRRFFGLAIIFVIVALFVIWFYSNTLLDLLPRLLSLGGLGPGIYRTAAGRFFAALVPPVFNFLMFLTLYRWVPNQSVRWSAAAVGALVAALGWELATNALSWYVSSGIAGYALVYGSLGAIVAFLFWVYLSSLIAIFGAHLSAAFDQRRQQGTGRSH